MDEEIIRLLRENNAMLKEILRYIAKSNSSEEQQKRQLTSFAINVTANVFCEDLTEQEKNNLKKELEWYTKWNLMQ